MIRIEEEANEIAEQDLEFDNGTGEYVISNAAIMSPDEWCNYINAWAQSKGWNEEEVNHPTRIALMHSELSEALEEFRMGNLDTYHNETKPEKPEGYWIELADCVIRIMHDFGQSGVSLSKALAQKMAYNEKRPYRHGNKVI